MVDAEKKSSKRIRNISTFSILIMLIFAWIVIDQVLESAKTAREDAVNNDLRVLTIMSQQIELAFIGIDNALRRAVDNRYYNERFGGSSPEFTLQNLQDLVEGSPRLAAIIMVDEHGQPLMAASRPNSVTLMDYQHFSFADNSQFQMLRDNGDKDYFIGNLPSGAKDDSSLIVMARKIKHMDGGFGGAFIAVIDPAFFIKYFSTIEQGSRSYMSLQVIQSGALLVENQATESYYNELNALARQEFGKVTDPSRITIRTFRTKGAIEVYGFVKLKFLPLLLTISLDEQDYLKNWHENSFKDFVLLGIFMVFGSLLSFFAITMARQIVQVEKSEAAAVLASQAKSEFLANMSHELRTPLNAIIGFSEMMNSGYFGQLNPKQKERIHDINLCGSHLLNLITDILEFSKGDAGKLELLEERVVMKELVNETMRMMNKKIKEKQMNMIVEVDDMLPDIMGDKRKIRQILLNLASNAIKFTPENGTVKIAVNQDANKNISMTVSDTGIGIAEKDIPVALSVFGQVHRNQSHEGTGLGLPLCKMFAELHGGRLALGSVLGEGTTVRITFPASRNIYV
ncbi:MAG TPA: ATP-binding protein [Rickettsiales bacterium]|nr:ATP-binding protein [Rickettsiales bacterium]